MSEQKRFTCRDEEGRVRLMPEVSLMDVIEALCRIEERGQGVLIMPRDEKQRLVSEGLRRAWEERRGQSGDGSRIDCVNRKTVPVIDGDEGRGTAG